METLSSTLQYNLVNHPKIRNFTWSQGQTLGSTPIFVNATIAAYLSTTLLFRSIMTSLPSIPNSVLKPITALHSLTLFLLSLTMAVGCTLSIFTSSSPPLVSRIICFPPGTPPSGPLFFWGYVFYLSKLLEFGDTLLIILSKSIQRLSFLHVYHHATVVVVCYFWLQTSQSLFPFGVVTNSTVHVIMYGYYFLCAVGLRPRWKRLVTDCQIGQFVFGFVVSIQMLYYHFAGSGCSGLRAWCFNAVFNASLFTLFINFHSKNYAKKREMVVKKCKGQ